VAGALEDLSRDALREQFEGNVFGVHELNSFIIPMMRKSGRGRIVINTSVLGYVAQKYKGAYIASKYALEGMADTLRLELWGTDIHVSMIEPGPIASAFRKNSLAAFKRHVDPARSVHAAGYKILLEKLAFEGPITKWTLPASACVPPLISALESPVPKARYQVTFPAQLMAVAKRVLSARRMDKILLNGL
jgi:NAD(P)-dependent dehydrogenase (short-subunit alcohol dehydrogenase family)